MYTRTQVYRKAASSALKGLVCMRVCIASYNLIVVYSLALNNQHLTLLRRAVIET